MSMPGALDFLVSEYPPPPPHSDVYGRHLLDASLTAADKGGEGGAGEGADTDNCHTAFENECERLRPDPPTAPVAILGYTPHPVEPLKFPSSSPSCLSSLRSTVSSTLVTFSDLEPSKSLLAENLSLCGSLSSSFAEAHERLTELRACQAVGRVRDGIRRRLEEERGEFER
eukprot:CAMPEP_0182480662 /NCGR_PEP_ID=MMETSP1319-20130603/36114_1 /TAXON_ID=172717 /ORGANISM="Bolidomonas pacifica, Strain RCC208" /LENGTH=170 /DNA_ID=CAMNT_0024682179 /DNA_START=187 /DNA_END=696 /DNA_ORIENTATION=-